MSPKSADQPPQLPVPIPRAYDEKRVREDFWPKFKRAVAKVPGLADVLALYYYLNSDKAPLRHKVSIIATLAYFILPFDAIPDILGVIGYTDDVAVALGLISFIGSEVMAPYRVYARKWLRGEVPADMDTAELERVKPEEKAALIEVKPIEVRREG